VTETEQGRIPQGEDGAPWFRMLVERIPKIAGYVDLVIADDPGHSIPLYISPQIEDLLGYPLSDWLGEGELWLQILHPEDAERMRRADEEARRLLTPLSAEYRMIAADGSVVWVSEKAAVVQDETTGTLYWQGVMVDITPRKQAEAQRELAVERLKAALETERQASERLRALDDMKNDFLNAVSHELRTPLAAVLGSALTLQGLGLDLSTQDKQELLQGVVDGARRLERLLGDLLDVDRLTRGAAMVERSPVDVVELVIEVAQHVIPNNHYIHVEPGSVHAEVDAPKVERIVENLLTNAVRHTPPGTSVWARASEEPGGVLLVVEDDEPGVPEEMRRPIFEPFQQAGDKKSKAKGLGIGLSLVARFAELHLGRAWVEERAGGGASFHVFLPSPEPA
jgi:two-component system sensor histidine kinase KdpD